jgi:hypothetical protein
MTERYFKFTDGERTYFRATKTRAYRSGTISRGGAPGFSANFMTTTGSYIVAAYPADEITKAEYAALVKAKAARIERAKAEVAARPIGDRTADYWRSTNFRGWGSSPSESWVLNSEVPQ